MNKKRKILILVLITLILNVCCLGEVRGKDEIYCKTSWDDENLMYFDGHFGNGGNQKYAPSIAFKYNSKGNRTNEEKNWLSCIEGVTVTAHTEFCTEKIGDFTTNKSELEVNNYTKLALSYITQQFQTSFNLKNSSWIKSDWNAKYYWWELTILNYLYRDKNLSRIGSWEADYDFFASGNINKIAGDKTYDEIKTGANDYAKAYSSFGFSVTTTSITMTKDGDYYYSNELYYSDTNSYKVSSRVDTISSNIGTVVNLDTTKKTFKIKIPASKYESYSSNFSVTIKASASYKILKAYDCDGQDVVSWSLIEKTNSNTFTLTLPPGRTCISDVTEKLDNKSQRIETYKYFKGKGTDYRNLLNFELNTTDYPNLTASDLCTTSNSTLKPPGEKSMEIGCLSISSENSDFGFNDWSSYSIEDSNGYCDYFYYVENNLQNLNSFSYTRTYDFGNVKSGQMVLKRDNPIIAKGHFIKTCYSYSTNDVELDTSNFVNSTELSNIPSLYFGDKELKYSAPTLKYKYDNNGNIVMETCASSGNAEYFTCDRRDGDINTLRVVYDVDYYLNPVTSEIGLGKTQNKSNNGEGFRFLGYGYISKFTDLGRTYIDFNAGNLSNSWWSNTNTTNNTPNFEIKTISNACEYTANKEIVISPPDGGNDELNLEFRIIDTSNPFPGKSGTKTRKVGSNWCSDESAKISDLNGDNIITLADVQIISSAIKNNKANLDMDANRDGEVNESDIKIYRRIVAGVCGSKDELMSNTLNCTNDNFKTCVYITNANNSYNKTKDGPIYKIVLTPDKIKEMKEYDYAPSYDSFDGITCETNDGVITKCESEYLKHFNINKLID